MNYPYCTEKAIHQSLLIYWQMFLQKKGSKNQWRSYDVTNGGIGDPAMNLAAELKQRFIVDADLARFPDHLIVAVILPSGAVEIIHNTKQLDTKMKYYIEQYDDEFKLKSNPAVQIIDYMLI